VIIGYSVAMLTSASRLLEMVERGVVPLGMQCFTGDPALIEVLGLTGFDFVMLDAEHCGANPRAMEQSVRVADAVGLVALVRVPRADDEVSIRRALEAGAGGVFVPMVRSAADVQAALDAALFPPAGTRGICPAVRAARYSFSDFGEYAARNNAEALVIPLIEHPDAVDDIEAICALEQVRMITFGAGDLAYAMGEGTQMLASPKVQEAYRRVLAVAGRHNVTVIGGPVLDPTPEACRTAVEDGVGVFCLGLDVLGFRRYCEAVVSAASAHR
jgi:2-keto-3-deoxy-L-rhamnonate aldolase RhmA